MHDKYKHKTQLVTQIGFAYQDHPCSPSPLLIEAKMLIQS